LGLALLKSSFNLITKTPKKSIGVYLYPYDFQKIIDEKRAKDE